MHQLELEFPERFKAARDLLDRVTEIAQLKQELIELTRKHERLLRSNAGLCAELDNVRTKGEMHRRREAQAIAILARVEDYLETRERYDKLELMKLLTKPIE